MKKVYKVLLAQEQQKCMEIIKDSLSVFKGKLKEVFCLKSLDDWEKHKNKNCVIVVNGPRDILWAKPVISGMFGGSFIYTSNGIVMKNYPHPIRLMDRVE